MGEEPHEFIKGEDFKNVFTTQIMLERTISMRSSDSSQQYVQGPGWLKAAKDETT